MKFSLNWLSRYLPLHQLSLPEIDQLLTFAGVEVEGTHTSGVRSDQIIIAEVMSFEQHPNADRLRLCQVNDGSGAPRQIVCGAKNFQPGDRVPLALPGAVMPAGFTIKSSKLRGVMSDGMLCSGSELGIPDDADGLLLLPKEAPVGRPLHEFLPPDTLLELEVTPNRPDLLSHQGMARELAALTGLPLTGLAEKSTVPSENHPEIQLLDPVGCPFYSARVIRGVKVGPSPKWLADALLSIGLRPINNLVDITNFVLHDLGQPLHVFDLNKLAGPITVRNATEGETFTALDQKTYALGTEDLVIADSNGPVALAGVMGGLDSSVTEETTDVLLESAWFQPSHIRHTSRKLGLMSDSSYRFERIADADLTLDASAIAARLILELAGGEAEHSVRTAGAPPIETPELTLTGDHARRLLGSDTPDEKISSILTLLGLESTAPETWKIPSRRPDLRRAVDLIEEIARVQGLDVVPTRAASVFTTPSEADRKHDALLRLIQQLAGHGLREARTLKLISPAQAATALTISEDAAPAIGMRNPIGEDHSILRPSLIPGLLNAAALNFRNGADHAAFFESGAVFVPSHNGEITESDRIAVLISGAASGESWQDKEPRSFDWHDLTAFLTVLLGRQWEAKPVTRPNYAPAAEIHTPAGQVGMAAQLSPSRAKALLDTKHPVFVCELDLSSVLLAKAPLKTARPLPRFPGATRDVALEMPLDLPQAKLKEFFASRKQPLLTETRMFDLFTDATGQKLPADRKSIAYRLFYQSAEKTLESQEVDLAHKEILDALTNELPVTIR